MSDLQNHRPNILDSSLDFEKEFTYINIIQDQLSREKKPSRLKIHSKISDPYLRKDNTNIKKAVTQKLTYRSQIRKKSKTVEKSLVKKKRSVGKSLQKNSENCNKRSGKGKAIELKLRELKSKSNRSLRSPITKRTAKDECKLQDPKAKKKKGKEDPELREKASKAHKNQANPKHKVQKTKSSTEFENIPLSSLRKKAKVVPTSNVVHDYFGMSDKLSSIIEEKNKNAQRTLSRLSKCKTQSSSSSISHKNLLKFHPKKTKAGK